MVGPRCALVLSLGLCLSLLPGCAATSRRREAYATAESREMLPAPAERHVHSHGPDPFVAERGRSEPSRITRFFPGLARRWTGEPSRTVAVNPPGERYLAPEVTTERPLAPEVTEATGGPGRRDPNEPLTDVTARRASARVRRGGPAPVLPVALSVRAFPEGPPSEGPTAQATPPCKCQPTIGEPVVNLSRDVAARRAAAAADPEALPNPTPSEPAETEPAAPPAEAEPATTPRAEAEPASLSAEVETATPLAVESESSLSDLVPLEQPPAEEPAAVEVPSAEAPQPGPSPSVAERPGLAEAPADPGLGVESLDEAPGSVAPSGPIEVTGAVEAPSAAETGLRARDEPPPAVADMRGDAQPQVHPHPGRPLRRPSYRPADLPPAEFPPTYGPIRVAPQVAKAKSRVGIGTRLMRRLRSLRGPREAVPPPPPPAGLTTAAR